MKNNNKTESKAVTLHTPAPAPSANPPLAESTTPVPQVDVIGRARSDYGRIPLLPGVEEKRRITGKGEAVLTLEAFNWSEVPLEHLARSKAAVAVMRAAAALKTATAAYERAIAK